MRISVRKRLDANFLSTPLVKMVPKILKFPQ
jgi:hypothetical protein